MVTESDLDEWGLQNMNRNMKLQRVYLVWRRLFFCRVGGVDHADFDEIEPKRIILVILFNEDIIFKEIDKCSGFIFKDNIMVIFFIVLHG